MKILVCIKQVPQKDAPLKLNEAGTWIREDVSYEVNEPDAYALEEALRQKEKHGGEVVVITSGPRVPSRSCAKLSPKAPTAPSTSKTMASWAWTHSTPPAPSPPPQRRAIRPDLYRPAIRRLWLRADRRDPRRITGMAARHHHHADREERRGIRVKRELEAGPSSSSTCRCPPC